MDGEGVYRAADVGRGRPSLPRCTSEGGRGGNKSRMRSELVVDGLWWVGGPELKYIAIK